MRYNNNMKKSELLRINEHGMARKKTWGWVYGTMKIAPTPELKRSKAQKSSWPWLPGPRKSKAHIYFTVGLIGWAAFLLVVLS